MFAYLQAAFWAAPAIPGIGRLPVNAILVLGLAILGFGHPGFWLLGLGAEAAYLYALSTSPRFQRLVDAAALQNGRLAATSQIRRLLEKLGPPARERLHHLEENCARILELNGQSQAEDFIIENDREALEKLTGLYLQLLVAAQNLSGRDRKTMEAQIGAQMASVKEELLAGKLSAALRESKEATLKILAQRLANFERRELALQQIASDLLRIEAQVDLALENAGMRDNTQSVSIALVSQLLADNALYGESGESIAELERTFTNPR